MPPPLTFLRAVAEALLGGAVDTSSAADAVWAAWGNTTAAGRGPEIRALVKLPPGDLEQAAAEAVAAVAGGQPPAVVQALTDYLVRIPETIRQSVRRSAAAGAARAKVTLSGPDDLVPFLPADLPPLSELALANTSTEVGSPLLMPTTVYRPAPPPEGSGGCRVCGAPPAAGDHLCTLCRGRADGWPELIPGYELVGELGRGGMGVVYQGVRRADGAVVAVKTLKPALAGSKTDVERFLREASVLQELDHPHVVRFHEMGEVDGLFYFVMDYVPGTDAAGLLARHGPLPVGRAVGLVCQLLEALDYAHARRFVHRDVKPANLLVTEAGGRDHVRLADFGLARVYQASRLSGLTMTGQVGGTPAFLPPEQITDFRKVLPAADQYSAAATLYNLLTGRHVHDLPARAARSLWQILEQDPVPIRSRRPDIPEELAAAIHRALEREPRRRFGSARAMRKALLGFLER